MILLGLVSSLSTLPLENETSEVNIIPDFPIPKTTFATADSGGHSFGGVVDYLFARVPPKYPRKHDVCIIHGRLLHVKLRQALYSKILLLRDAGTWSIIPTIVEAKKDRLTLAIP